MEEVYMLCVMTQWILMSMQSRSLDRRFRLLMMITSYLVLDLEMVFEIWPFPLQLILEKSLKYLQVFTLFPKYPKCSWSTHSWVIICTTWQLYGQFILFHLFWGWPRSFGELKKKHTRYLGKFPCYCWKNDLHKHDVSNYMQWVNGSTLL